MNRKELIIVFLPLVITWYIDHITKVWASGLTGPIDLRFMILALHHNPGAMLGLFSDLPPVLRIVSLSTGGALLVCIYSLLQYLLPIKSLMLRSGMSILLGGILGNVTDRILWGHVVDFLIFTTGKITSPAFNFADAFQWLGYGFIAYAIIKEGQILWPENNLRKHYWVNIKFQLKYCFFLLGIGLGLSLITAVFSYTYLKVTMIELIGHNPALLNKFLTPFAITFSLIVLGASIALFTVGKIISHKIAGPIHAFEKYILELLEPPITQEKTQLNEELLKEKDPSLLAHQATISSLEEAPLALKAITPREFKLRVKDEFKNLEDLAQKIRFRIIANENKTPPNNERTNKEAV